MAILKTDKKEIKVKDNSSLIGPCRKLGVLFGCENGVCGSCMIKVEEGMENLSKMTEQEENMMMEKGFRLACQCIIKKGTIKIKI